MYEKLFFRLGLIKEASLQLSNEIINRFYLTKESSLSRKLNFLAKLLEEGTPAEKIGLKAKELGVDLSQHMEEIVRRAFGHAGLKTYRQAETAGIITPRHSIKAHVGDVATYAGILARKFEKTFPTMQDIKRFGTEAFLHDIGRGREAILGVPEHGIAGSKILERIAETIAKGEKKLTGKTKYTKQFFEEAQDIITTHSIKQPLPRFFAGKQGPKRAIIRAADELADLMKRKIYTPEEQHSKIMEWIIQKAENPQVWKKKVGTKLAEPLSQVQKAYNLLLPSTTGGLTPSQLEIWERSIISKLIQQYI